MRTLAQLFLLACICGSVEARLGDTATKVEERYGKPVEIYRDVKGRIGHVHRSDGWIVLVHYIDGVSQSEVYAKEGDAELSDSELQAKLSANASGGKWEEVPKSIVTRACGPGWRAWAITRTRAMGAYGPCTINDRHFQHAISVGTHVYNEQNKALDRR